MTGNGRIYDPDELEKLIETYMEHGDLMGWGDQGESTEREEDDSQQEDRDDE